MPYGSDVKNACRRAFVEEEKSPEAISDEFGGQPSAPTIYRWAGPKPKEGETAAEGSWWAQREAHSEQLYRDASPAGFLRDVAELVQQVKDGDDPAVKKADSYAKLAAAVEKLSRPEMQLPAMYHVLEEFVRWTKHAAPAAFDQAFLLRVRAFKNHLRARVERGGL